MEKVRKLSIVEYLEISCLQARRHDHTDVHTSIYLDNFTLSTGLHTSWARNHKRVMMEGYGNSTLPSHRGVGGRLR